MVTVLAARSQMTVEPAQTAKTNQNLVVLAEKKLCEEKIYKHCVMI